MVRTVALIIFLSFGWQAAQAADEKPTQKQARTATSLTGMIDQRGDTYVLTTKATADGPQAEAVLKGRGFSDDNFARYVGYMVQVKGEWDKEHKVFQVTAIEKVQPATNR